MTAALPDFTVAIAPPDLADWAAGNGGIPGVISHAAAAAGPHVVLVALTHGNEYAGAIVLDALLRAGTRPLRGRLTVVFANLAAYALFDETRPTLSRFVDEDLNRLWDPAILDGPRHSAELLRARALRPVLESADILLDLHSMLWEGEPLTLCGTTDRGRALAERMGEPALIVADRGHASGRRLIDHPSFADPGATATALLVEAGQHWSPATVATARRSVENLLRETGLLAAPPPAPSQPRFAEVTATITATTGHFAFTRAYRGGDVIPDRGTLIAHDGDLEIRTPHDACLLVMPSLRPARGHTAVRLARFMP